MILPSVNKDESCKRKSIKDELDALHLSARAVIRGNMISPAVRIAQFKESAQLVLKQVRRKLIVGSQKWTHGTLAEC